MKTVLTICLVLITSYLIAQTIDPCDRYSIQTQSEVDTLVVPDEIYLSIITNEKENKTQLEELETEIKAALSKVGINPEKQLKLDDFGSYYESKLFRKKITQRRKYELKVMTSKKAISAIVSLNKLDIGDISLIRTGFSQKDELMLELRKKAVLKAKAQAESLVTPLGQSIGKAILIMDIDENKIRSVMSGGYLEQNISKYKKEMKSAQIDLNPINYTKRIVVNFELK